MLSLVRGAHDLAELVPAGTTRRLKLRGSTRFTYPSAVDPRTGEVILVHSVDGSFMLRVDRCRGDGLSGRVAQLFAEGRLRLDSRSDLEGFLVDELAPTLIDPPPDLGHGQEDGSPVDPQERHTNRGSSVDPAEVAALRTQQVSRPTAERLLSALRDGVAGQDAALRQLARATARHIRKPNPAAPLSALLIGPTGVGKTETALRLHGVLAEAQPNRSWSRVIIDCGEITGPDQLNRVLGAAPGFVGFDQGSPLAEALANGPAVLVFDEIEKAHSALINHVLLAALDRGRIGVPNPGRGGPREADARDSIIVMTSNLAVGELRPGMSEPEIRAHLRMQGLSAEIVGRMSVVLQFHHLDDEAMCTATVSATRHVLAEYGVRLRGVEPGFVAAALDLADHGAGVRGIRAAIEGLLEPALTEECPTDVDLRWTGTTATLSSIATS